MATSVRSSQGGKTHAPKRQGTTEHGVRFSGTACGLWLTDYSQVEEVPTCKKCRVNAGYESPGRST